MKEFRKAHDEASNAGQSLASQPAVPAVPPAVAPAPQVPVQVSTAAPPVAAVPAQPVSTQAPSGSSEQVTLSRSELDALLAVARERAAQTSDKPDN